MLRGALGTLFATNATSRQKIFNEIKDLRAAACAANPLIYKAFFFLLVSLWSKIVPTIRPSVDSLGTQKENRVHIVSRLNRLQIQIPVFHMGYFSGSPLSKLFGSPFCCSAVPLNETVGRALIRETEHASREDAAR
jgi:hypothetical protein